LVKRAPSIQIVCPLMKEAPGLARNTTVGAMSPGLGMIAEVKRSEGKKSGGGAS